MIAAYPKVYNLGHRNIQEIFQDSVIVEEKIDGSSISFAKINGELFCRSKGAHLNIIAPEKMFTEGVQKIQEIFPLMKEGWVYRGEYLKKPKHNTLCYDRIPKNHIIGFDVEISQQSFLTHEQKVEEFSRLGFETVPKIFEGKIENYEIFRNIIDNTISVLGSVKIEGIVVKNYLKFGADAKFLVGKFVSEEFKEVHQKDWKDRNPTNSDIFTKLVEEYGTKARWNKAIQHLKERGELTTSLKDIGKLLQEIKNDIKEECSEEIKDKIFNWAWKNIERGLTKGFPEYYKEYLIKENFEKKEKE